MVSSSLAYLQKTGIGLWSSQSRRALKWSGQNSASGFRLQNDHLALPLLHGWCGVLLLCVARSWTFSHVSTRRLYLEVPFSHHLHQCGKLFLPIDSDWHLRVAEQCLSYGYAVLYLLLSLNVLQCFIITCLPLNFISLIKDFECEFCQMPCPHCSVLSVSQTQE